MIEAPRNRSSTVADESISSGHKASKGRGAIKQGFGQVGKALKHYPLPLGALALLFVGLLLWLVGWTDLVNLTLLVIVLLGGVPLLLITFLLSLLHLRSSKQLCETPV